MRISRDNVQGFLVACARALLFVGISYVILFPIMSKLSASFMEELDLYDQTVRWIPRNFTFDHYIQVFRHMKYPEAFLNSVSLSLIISLLTTVSCALVGYGFSRFRFPGRSFFFGLVIFALIVPPQMIMIPLYLNFRYFDFFGLLPFPGINLLNSNWSFYLTSATATGLRSGLYIYIMRQMFSGLPQELEDAAYVDGAGPIRTFWTVMLPGAYAGLLVVFLFSFVMTWNDDFLIPLFGGNQVLLTNTLVDVPRSMYGIHYHTEITSQYVSLLYNTGSILFLAPLLLLYAVMQRYFIESVERTGLVG